MKKIFNVSKDTVVLPKESEYRQQLMDNVEKVIDEKKIFCATVEALIEGLEDSRLATQRGTIDALNEHHRYSTIMKQNKVVWINHAKDREGFTKIYFEV